MSTKTLNIKDFARRAAMLLLLLVTAATAWAKDPFGYVNVCTGHQGSIYLELWALDEDDLSARTTIHVYLRQNGQNKYVYNLGATDLYRADAINTQFAGDHAMHRYLNVPVAGTYDVYVYVINAAGGGTNPLCEHAWKGAPYPNYASVTTSSPYTVTYNANGGSGAPAATTKSYGINLTLSSTQPTRSGYLFTGWNTAADGSGTTYNSGAAYTGNANLTLYAQWAQSGNNSVEMASGTHDASHWSFSSNTANFGNTITVNYSGYLNLESVTLRRKTTNTYELNSSNISTAVSNFNSQSGSRLVFTANISEQQTFTCTEGEIDMNGHSSSKDLLIQNNELGKTITIKNGTVTGTDGAGGFNDYYNGTVVLENMTVTGRVWTDGHPYVINGGTYAEIINDINANTPGTVTIYDGKFSQLGNWGSGGTFTLYGGKYAINPSSLAYCTIPSGYSVQSNTDSDSGTYPWVVRNTGLPVANPYSLAVTEVTANRQWTFTMPPYDVEVVVNYAPSIPYFAYNTTTNTYEELDAPNCTAVTTSTTTMGAANTETWYLVNSNVTVNNTRIEVLGTVNLILTDGKSLRAEKGIHVPPGVTLNIYGQSGGTGQLYGFSNTNYIAGIGGNSGEASGTVNIHGGTIQAWGADNSAGIGGGTGGNGGTTTIYGGSVNSTGVEGGAGIGGGYGGNGGIITIYGGDVVARGSYKWGAGIGGGRNGNGGTISIYGGTINATGGEAAAGIGGGIAANCGIITITGGTVIAQAQTVYDGDNSQAIGSGAGTVSGGTLTIDNMRVYSSANAANPVAPANHQSTCHSKYAKLMPCTHNYEDGVCTICGGIELIGTGGPGTYLAYQTATHSFVELTADNPTIVDASTTTMGVVGTETWYIADNDVTISGRIMVNGTVHLILNDGTTLTANGGIDVTEGKSLHIHSQRERSGQLIATATDGAGIGGGSVGNITIHGGNITATGGAWSAGIGGGTNGGGGSITIYRGNVEGIGWREGNRGNAVGIGRGSGGGAVAIQADRLRLQYYYNGWQDATYSQRASALEYAHVRFFPCTEHSYSNGRCTHCGKYQWYTVTYNGNGNTGGSVPTDNTHYPLDGTGTVTVRGNTGNLARTGYTFSGWNTQADGLGTDYAPGATFTINGATTLYAKWMPITYTVRFHKNHDDATGTMSDQAFTYDIAQKLTANAFTREGYQCLGWSTTTDGAVAYTNGQSVSNLATVQGTVVNLYAQWAMPYTITYDLAGGSVATPNPTNYTIESDAITLVNPTRDGYTFAGWTGTGLAGPTMTVTIPKGSTGDRAYTATWTLNTYTITYDLAGGSVATPNPTTYNELSDAITLTNPTREGYTFAGWTGTDISGTAMTVTIPAGSSGNRSYTAHWLVNDSAYLAYNTTTGEFEPLAFPAGIVTSGTTTMGTANNESWYIVNENVSISDRITVNGTVHLILADGTTLTASKGITVNSGNTLNIYGQTSGTGALNATGAKLGGDGTEAAGIGSTNNSTVGNITIHGSRITANSAGWTAGIGGGIRGGGGSITIYGGTINATGHGSTSEGIGHGADGANVTKNLAEGLCVIVNNYSIPVAYGDRVSSLSQLVVRVEPCTEHNLSNNVCTYCGLSSYGVTYNSNNATSGTVPANAYYVSGQTVTVPGNTGNLERMGYTFGGWNTKANGSGTTYAEGETFAINGNTTLYAKWTPITYTVRFNKNHNDATGTMSNQTFTYDVAQALATNAFTRDGWYFVGWSTETNSSSTYTDGQSIINLATEQDAVVNLYALWVQAIYTISYDLSGGTVATPNPTTYHELSGDITLVNPTKVGYYFVGWTGTGLTEPSKTVTIPAGSTGNRTYTATWIEMPLTEDTDEAEGTAAHWYVNMPATDTKTVTLSDATVTTFKVYDDGGKNGNYSFGCSGYLVLTAPAGYVLQLSGSIMSEKNYDKLTVYDGNDNSGTILLNAVCSTKDDGTQTAITPVLSRGQSMTLYFYDSHNNFVNYTYAGLDLTVTLIDSNVEYNIDIVDAGNNNTLTASFGGNAVTTAKYNDVVTLTASPASGYLLKDFSVVDASGNDMSVTDMRWYTGASTATFTMPASAVTITSTFTNTWTAVGGLYINMPATGTVTATIPAGVQSFKVYDNGGAGGNYSNNCSGYLVLTAPTGYVLQLSGSITSQYYDYLTVYDGNDDSGTTLLNKVNSISTAAITTVTSTGQSMTLYFYSNGGQNYAGLDLTVTLLPVLELANNADNSDAISAADGNNRNVTLAGRTLYTDGDWNTLCLPFALASFAGTPLEGATVKTLTSSNFEDGTLTMTFSDNQTSIEAGKPYIVKYDADLFIRTAADWNNFATNVNNGTESYQGKVVKLAADISVSTMVGDESHPFKGTFDGCGHTLTFNYTTDADNAAPFQWIKNAVIRNLTVMGEITSSKMFAAGFVARAHGDNAIESCVSSVTIHASKNGDGTHGGFVGRIESDCQTFTFTDCKFNGTFDGSNTDNWCPFAAWSMGNSNTNFIFNNCLCSPTGANVRSGNATFYRNGTPTLNGAYYTQAIGTAQGTNASGMSNETLASNLGDGWEISGGNVVPKMMNTANDIVNPVFKDVTISDATANVSTAYVDFVGTYSPVGIYESGDKHNLYLGSGNNLYYPSREGYSLKACRAYFQLKGITAGDPTSPTSARAFVLNFGDDEEQTGIRTITIDDRTSSPNRTGIYTLDGRKVGTASDASDSEKLKALQPGMYIVNGKKTFIK